MQKIVWAKAQSYERMSQNTGPFGTFKEKDGLAHCQWEGKGEFKRYSCTRLLLCSPCSSFLSDRALPPTGREEPH